MEEKHSMKADLDFFSLSIVKLLIAHIHYK